MRRRATVQPVSRLRAAAAVAAVAVLASVAGGLPAAGAAPAAPAAATAAAPAPEGYDPVTRIGGADRYEVAVNALGSTGLRARVGVVASGEVFSDALPAGAAAAHRGAPVLLTRRAALPASTLAETGIYNYSAFTLVGGLATISEAVLDRLARDGTVERIAREDRYANAAALATTTFTGPVSVVHVTSGEVYSDALSAVPAAARAGGPVLLTRRDTLPAATKEALEALDPERIVVVGGPASVSTSVLRSMKAHATQGVTRVSGADRYEVSAALSRSSFDPGVRVAYLVSGENYPDALAAGPQAGLQRGPVLLTRKDTVPPAILAELTRLQPRRIVVLGGPASVSDAVLTGVEGLTRRVVSTAVDGSGPTSCSITSGSVECWGSGDNGQLGIGSSPLQLGVPVPVAGITRPVVQVSAGVRTVCAVDTAQHVWCWGARTGLSSDDRLSAVEVPGITDALSVSANDRTACAVRAGGTVSCWGYYGSIVFGVQGPGTETVTPVEGLPGPVTAVSVGWMHACALTATYEVWCWGSSSEGQTGVPDRGVVHPTEVDLGGPVGSVAAGALHTCAVLVAGGVRCWGSNFADQLGVPSPTSSVTPLVPAGLDTATGTVSAGLDRSCLLRDGTATCWGADRTPAVVSALGTSLASLSAGRYGTCGRRDDGAAVCTAGLQSGRAAALPASTTGVRVTGY